MNQEKFAVSLQQDLITLLVHSDQYGKSVAKVVGSNFFEGDYRTIVEKALSFWEQHKAAPKQHIADLLSDILEDSADRRGQTYRRILVQMLEVKDQINPDFVLRSMNQFIRMQRAKEVILQAAEQLDSRGIAGLGDVESILRRFLLEDKNTVDAGLRLSEIDRVLEYLTASTSEFTTGIKELDQNHIVPMRGKLWLFMAPAKKGKTWMLIQLGKMAFMQRKKVLHVSLEIEAEEVAQRYYQSMFGASKRDDSNKIPTLRFDRNQQLDQIVTQTVEAPFTFKSGAIREELQTRINHFGMRADNIVIKRFPMSSLTLEQFEAYLESLESVEKFVPDLVILDYPKIMKLNVKEIRVSLGALFEGLRGMSQRRNFALAAVHQGNRASDTAELVKASAHLSEDWSIAGTVDFLITYSQTAAEKNLGLARLFVDLARSEADKIGVLITQSYKTGQFVIESTRLSDSYARLLEGMQTSADDEDGADGADD
jgi:replicative DNA helicase